MTDYVYFQKVEFGEELKGKTIAKVGYYSCEGESGVVLGFTDGTWLEISYESIEDESIREVTAHLEFALSSDEHLFTKLDGPWVREDDWDGDIPWRADLPEQKELTNIPGILSSDIPINSERHRSTDKVCPLCRLNPAWEHIPYLEEATWDNYDNPMLACWGCFHAVWAGER